MGTYPTRRIALNRLSYWPETTRSASRGWIQEVRAREGSRNYGVHCSVRPFERLNVLAVQNAAALRYQTW